jgi:hypothetical protein
LRRHAEERLDQAWALLLRRLLPPPPPPAFDGTTRFALVTVNFSTTRWLLLSLLTLGAQKELRRITDIVIVDNGSRDGGRPLLRRLAARVPRLTLIENERFLNHARGMRLGIAALDRIESPANVILSVDTDVIFLRPDMLAELARLFEQGAAFAGEMRHGLYDIPEAQASLITVRRDLYARREIVPWVNHGAPSYWLQKSMRRAGLAMSDFASYREGYALHRGRAGVRAASLFHSDSSYASISNNNPHFMGNPQGEALWNKVEQRWQALLEPAAEDALVDELALRFG